MAKYLKEEIAFIQLTTAIELFNQKNFISAITLASAAEELFSAFLFHFAKSNVTEMGEAEVVLEIEKYWTQTQGAGCCFEGN
jgi:hypothetical protein